MRAALYSRVSTKEQVDGYSLSDQMRTLRMHAKDHGYEIVAEIEDAGHSGAYLERPGMDRVRDLVAAGGVDIVLAQDADRITREPADRSVLDLEAERHGCRWVALDDWGDDSHEGQLLKYLKGWMAKGERSKIAERMQRGKRQRAREGKIVPAGRPPLGYEYVGGTYRIDESNMVLVRRIFSLAAGGMSLWRIKKTFESEGILTPGSTYKGPSRYWNANTIRRIIKRDEYLAHGPEDIQGLVAAGQLTPTVAATLRSDRSYGISWYNRHHTSGTGNRRLKGEEKPRSEWIAVPVPDAGIPREQVEKARANLKGERAPRADNRFWELSGHLFCKCGVKLVARVTHKNGHSYPYYVCSRHVRDGCEHGKWMRADRLEHEVYWALRNVQPQDLYAQIQTLIDRERSPEAEIKAAHAVLEDVARQRVKIQTMAARDLITLDELEVHLDGLDNRRRAAQEQIEVLQSTSERVERLRLMQRNPILTLMGQTEDMRRDYYTDLELRVEVDKGDVNICGVFGSQSIAPTSTSGKER
jgi:site-specific DNA recombinase